MVPEIIGDVIIYALPAVTAGITVFLTMAGFYLNRKYQNSKLTQILLIVDQVVVDVVNELNQTVVEGLKAARSDGKLTKDETEQIKHKAIEMVLRKLGIDIFKTLQASLGPVSEILERKIEAAVLDQKRSRRITQNKGKIGPALVKKAIS